MCVCALKPALAPLTPPLSGSFSLMTAAAVLDGAAGVDESEGPKCYEFSHGWLRHSEAEARFSGTISSMGSRKCVK